MKTRMFRKLWVLLLALLLGSAGTANAETLFEDNFDSHANWQPRPGTNDVGTAGASAACDQGDCTGKVPQGWSFFRATGWWWGDQYQDTIRVNGDNFRGASGKGYTQWNESNYGSSGDGWGADGILTKLFPTDHKELYIRFWMKMKPGFKWPTTEDGILKIFRVAHYDRSGSSFLFFSGGNSGPIYLFDLKKSSKWGWRHMHSFRCDPQESAYYCPDGDATDGLFETSSTLPSDQGQAADGNWHRYDFRFKMNSYSGGAWQADGVIQFWFDGDLKYSKANKKWVVSGTDTSIGWNTIGIGGNAYNNYSDSVNKSEQWYAFDDVVVSTTSLPDTGEVILSSPTGLTVVNSNPN